MKAAVCVQTAATKPTTPDLVVATYSIEDISDFIDPLPLQACVELTLRLLTSFYPSPLVQLVRGLS